MSQEALQGDCRGRIRAVWAGIDATGGCFHGEQESGSAGGLPAALNPRDLTKRETRVRLCDSPRPQCEGLARPLSRAGTQALRMPPPKQGPSR